MSTLLSNAPPIVLGTPLDFGGALLWGSILGAATLFLAVAVASLISVEKDWLVKSGKKGVGGALDFIRGYFQEHNRLVVEAKRISYIGSGTPRIEGGGPGHQHSLSSSRSSPNLNLHQSSLQQRRMQRALSRGQLNGSASSASVTTGPSSLLATGPLPSHRSSSGIREVSSKRILAEAFRQIRFKYVAPATLFSVLLCCVNFAEPVVIGRFWDCIEKLKTSTEFYRPACLLLGYRLGLVIVRYLLNVLVGILFANAKADMTRRVRHEVFGLLLGQDTQFYEGVKSSELLDRLKRDPETMEEFVDRSLEKIFNSIVDLLCGLYLIMNYSWYLSGGSILLKALPITMITVRAGKLVSMYSLVQRHSLQQADAVAAEALGNLMTVRTHAAEDTEKARHDKMTRRYLSVLLHTLYTESFLRHLRSFTRQAMELGFVVLAAYCMVNEGLSMGRLLAFKSCLEMFVRGFNTLSELYAQMTKLKRTSVRYFDLLDGTPLIEGEREDAIRPTTCIGNIKIEDLTFSYPTRESIIVLNDVTLDIPAGRLMAFVGQAGSGKSSLVKLIQRLYDPTEGNIYLDGNDIRDLDLRWYRKQVGYIPSESVLFDCSLAENISYGLKLIEEKDKTGNVVKPGPGEVTIHDVMRAAQLANIHEFIQSLPDGYSTPAGTGGILLTGGQRQRITIARAVIRNPRILIFHECINQLDSESEQAIQIAIDNLVPNRTVIMIAHRTSTIRKAHKIVVFHDGKICQLGTHAELLKEGGRYTRLVNEQLWSSSNDLRGLAQQHSHHNLASLAH